jgi:hypothetical protein
VKEIKFLLLLLMLAPAVPAAAFELTTGNRFPQVTLPSISTGKEISFKDQLGEKLMLHLFASW